jgi:hypothetical protein
MLESPNHPSGAAAAWLLWLADPAPRRAPPASSLTPAECSSLLDQAERHGVLTACLARLKQTGVALCVSKDEATAIISAKTRRSIELISVQMMLAHHGKAVIQSLEREGVPFILVKGKTFAKRLYLEMTHRGYTDIDLLIPSSARADASFVLRKQRFELHDMEYRKGSDYFEDKWLLGSNPNIMIEVHCDMVHNPKLRRSFSLQYDDVLDAGHGDPLDATALLFIAAVHGAAGHQFDRLQQLVDVLLCARGAGGPVDAERLRAVSDRCGVTGAIVAALDLAGRTFDDAACRALTSALRPSVFQKAAGRLLSPGVVLGTQSRRRPFISWRRKAFRQTLRYSSRRSTKGRGLAKQQEVQAEAAFAE